MKGFLKILLTKYANLQMGVTVRGLSKHFIIDMTPLIVMKRVKGLGDTSTSKTDSFVHTFNVQAVCLY